MPNCAYRCCAALSASKVIGLLPNCSRTHLRPICCRNRRSSSVMFPVSRRWHSLALRGSDSSILVARFCATEGRPAAAIAEQRNGRRRIEILLSEVRIAFDGALAIVCHRSLPPVFGDRNVGLGSGIQIVQIDDARQAAEILRLVLARRHGGIFLPVRQGRFEMYDG